MRTLIACEFMSLDGVVQAPAYPDEDMTGGFKHGGWNVRYLDAASMKWVVENVTTAGGFLLGRRTYDTFAAHWPNASAEEQPLARPLNALPKYVASRTLKAPLAWHNSTLLESDVPAAVSRLKHEAIGNLVTIGSTELLHTLMAHDLVDELRVMIDPVILGGGKRFFLDDGRLTSLRLVASEVTGTGAILATYARDAR